MKYLIVICLSTLITACNLDHSQDFKLVALSPASYNFKQGQLKKRIDYFYLDGHYSYDTLTYKKLQQKIAKKTNGIEVNNYENYSVYIYQKTSVLNEHYHGGKEGLDGYNQDLLAYIRYYRGQADIFYIIRKGNVIYDLVAGKDEHFEFEQ